MFVEASWNIYLSCLLRWGTQGGRRWESMIFKGGIACFWFFQTSRWTYYVLPCFVHFSLSACCWIKITKTKILFKLLNFLNFFYSKMHSIPFCLWNLCTYYRRPMLAWFFSILFVRELTGSFKRMSTACICTPITLAGVVTKVLKLVQTVLNRRCLFVREEEFKV